MIPVTQLVPAALRVLLRRQPLSPAKVAFAWRCATGDAIARAARVTLGPDGTLDVKAADRHWGREIERLSREILPRLQELLGRDVVRRLNVRVATHDRP